MERVGDAFHRLAGNRSETDETAVKLCQQALAHAYRGRELPRSQALRAGFVKQAANGRLCD